MCLAMQGREEPDLYLMFNASTDPVSFVLLPVSDGGRWHLAVDTFVPALQDLFEPGAEIVLEDQSSYRVEPRSSAILLAQS